jgi:uncharacterized membrane protein
MKIFSNHSFVFIIFFAVMFISQIQLNSQSITWIGPFDEYAFTVSDVSDDGKKVVGTTSAKFYTLAVNMASRWTASAGIKELGTLPDRNNSVTKAGSSDGNVVVGFSYYFDGSQGQDYAAFRWTSSGGMQAIVPDAASSQAYGVSGDGSVVVGAFYNPYGPHPFRWTANGGLEDLTPILGIGVATGVSDDGSVVVGYVVDTLSTITRPFRLRGNSLEIDSSSGFHTSKAWGISGDGNTVFGTMAPLGPGYYIFRWDSLLQNLGWVNDGFASRANYDGSIIVGRGYITPPFTSEDAWRWTSSNDFQDLNVVYSNLLPNNFELLTASSISNDGRYIVGNAGDGVNPEGRAYLLDTQSNLHITEPTSLSKFIAGETALIKWTGGESGQTLQIEYSNDDGANWFFIDYAQAQNGQYVWEVPSSILTTKAKIKITDVDNTPTFDESDKFKIKPYVLTRIDANGDYYEYRKNRDQWGFWNNPNDMWPQTWWQQFNYQGTDPFTLAQYSQTQGNGTFANSNPQDHSDWVSWVRAFGVNACYYSTSQRIYSDVALYRWWNISGNWGGSCFGIAAANALAFRYRDQFTNRFLVFPNFTNPINVASDSGVKRVVNELYTHQYGNPSATNDVISSNKTPYQTLNELKQMLIEDDATIRTLSIFNNGGSGGHTILAYGLEQDTAQTNLYYVKVYDNSNPNSNNPITFDLLANSGNGAWSTPDYSTWGGSKGIYLEVPSVNYLNNALNKLQNSQSPFIRSSDELEINVPTTASIQIIDDQNNITGYNNGNVFNDIPGSLPRFVKNGSEDPPYGYHLQTGNYSVVLSDFTESISNTFFSTGNKSIMYERFGAFTGQRDSLHFDGGIFVNNPDPDYKEITLLNLFDEGTQEKSFTASGLQLLQDNSVKIENPDSNTIKIISYGVDNSYNIELNYVTENEFGRFYYSGLSLYPTMSHTFVPDWTNLTVADLKVLIDFESDGIIDDSLLLQNQSTDVDDQGTLLTPNSFNLAQNYPNPFNPSTKIRYSIPDVGSGLAQIVLKVYDILGNEVATLVNEEKPAGVYEVTFDASELSSGIYFYKLSAGSFNETKKMTLLK